MNDDDRQILAIIIIGVLFVTGLLVFTILRDRNAFDRYDRETTTTVNDSEEDR